MPSFAQLLVALAQTLLLAAAAPFASGCLRVVRAKMHTRHGPGVLQDYRDLVKLMKRQDVRPPAAVNASSSSDCSGISRSSTISRGAGCSA